jgi:hypothetical protein
VESFAGLCGFNGMAGRRPSVPRRTPALHKLWKNLLNTMWGREVIGQ